MGIQFCYLLLACTLRGLLAGPERVAADWNHNDLGRARVAPQVKAAPDQGQNIGQGSRKWLDKYPAGEACASKAVACGAPQQHEADEVSSLAVSLLPTQSGHAGILRRLWNPLDAKPGTVELLAAAATSSVAEPRTMGRGTNSAQADAFPEKAYEGPGQRAERDGPPEGCRYYWPPGAYGGFAASAASTTSAAGEHATPFGQFWGRNLLGQDAASINGCVGYPEGQPAGGAQSGGGAAGGSRNAEPGQAAAQVGVSPGHGKEGTTAYPPGTLELFDGLGHVPGTAFYTAGDADSGPGTAARRLRQPGDGVDKQVGSGRPRSSRGRPVWDGGIREQGRGGHGDGERALSQTRGAPASLHQPSAGTEEGQVRRGGRCRGSGGECSRRSQAALSHSATETTRRQATWRIWFVCWAQGSSGTGESRYSGRVEATAPSIGPCRCLREQYGPGTTHSITVDWDYVSPWWASTLALNTQLEVTLQHYELEGIMTFAQDPRLHDDDGLYDERPCTGVKFKSRASDCPRGAALRGDTGISQVFRSTDRHMDSQLVNVSDVAWGCETHHARASGQLAPEGGQGPFSGRPCPGEACNRGPPPPSCIHAGRHVIPLQVLLSPAMRQMCLNRWIKQLTRLTSSSHPVGRQHLSYSGTPCLSEGGTVSDPRQNLAVSTDRPCPCSLHLFPRLSKGGSMSDPRQNSTASTDVGRHTRQCGTTEVGQQCAGEVPRQQAEVPSADRALHADQVELHPTERDRPEVRNAAQADHEQLMQRSDAGELARQYAGRGPRPRAGGPSVVRALQAARVELLPAEWDRPEARTQALATLPHFAGFRASGSVADIPQQDRYAIFATDRHAEVRTMGRGWTIEQLIEDVLSIVPRTRAVQILLQRLEHFPAIQVAATTHDAPRGFFALPVDFRPVEGRVCTVYVRCGMTAQEIADVCHADCPAPRLPRGPYYLDRPDRSPFERIEADERSRCPAGRARAAPSQRPMKALCSRSQLCRSSPARPRHLDRRPLRPSLLSAEPTSRL